MPDAEAVTGEALIRPAYTADQVRAAEAPLLAAGEPLMDRAAAALATIVGRVTPAGQRILVLVGGGDNGGDALLAGAALAGSDRAVDILTVADRIHERGAAAARAAGCRRVELAEAVAAAEAGGYAVIVDGMLGIGARGGLRGAAQETAAMLTGAVGRDHTPVIAVDLPSGLDPDTGEAGADVLPASTTVTFGAPKIGLARGRGAQLAGHVVLVELGLALAEADSPGTVTAEIYRA